MKIALLVIAAAGVALVVASSKQAAGEPAPGRAVIGNPACGTRPGNVGHGTPLSATGNHQLAAFAQGCFWGVEERFRKVPGVVATAVGYTGGQAENPSYDDVCTHGTGHAEAVLVEFDPGKVTYQRLLQFFWETHDPTSGDAQGPDRGSQYRSAIFTFSDEQERAALASRGQAQKALAEPITTEIAKAGKFWVAEGYHQQWDEKHGALSCPLPHRPRQK